MEINNTGNYNKDETIDLISILNNNNNFTNNSINDDSIKSRRNNITKTTPNTNNRKCSSKKSTYKRNKKILRTIYRRTFTIRNILLASMLCIILKALRQTRMILQKTSTHTFNRIPYNLADIAIPIIKEEAEVQSNPEWCLRGPKDKECSCSNPSIPQHRLKIRHWGRAHHLNQDGAVSFQNKKLDVLFLGDSITEEWEGMRYGFPVEGKLEIIPVFQKLFTTRGGGSLNGLPLGINGDTSTNLLWRIQNGELPAKLNPSVIWLLIGTNDFGVTWCTPSVTFLGIRKVIQHVRSTKPSSTLVINGLLPRTFHKKGYVNRIQYLKHGKYSNRPIGPNIWKDILLVNTALKEYVEAENDDQLKYFDVGDLFFIPGYKDEMDIRINQTLMLDFLHPAAAGHDIWGQQIVKYVEDIILHLNHSLL